MDTFAIPTPAAGFIAEAIDGDFLLYHPTGNRIVQLNGPAALVWRLCDGKRSQSEIITLLQEAYPEAANEIAADVPATLDELVKNGCIQMV